ncbi:hypothetical protein NBRC116583_32740 [Arenicella sp. 4NH20-0111]
MPENGILMSYRTTQKVLNRGNYVGAVSEDTFTDQPTAYSDLFKVKNGEISEY